jgi:hypothetical protein
MDTDLQQLRGVSMQSLGVVLQALEVLLGLARGNGLNLLAQITDVVGRTDPIAGVFRRNRRNKNGRQFKVVLVCDGRFHVLRWDAGWGGEKSIKMA